MQRQENLFPFDWENYRSKFECFSFVKLAERCIRKDDLTDPEIAMAAMNLAAFYIHTTGQYDEAIKLLNVAVKTLDGKDKRWAHCHLAFAYLKKDDEKSAYDATQKATQKLLSSSASCWDVIACTYGIKARLKNLKSDIERTKYFKNAIGYYEQLENPGNFYAETKLEYATMLFREKKYEKALDQFLELRRYWRAHWDEKNPSQQVFNSISSHCMHMMKIRIPAIYKRKYDNRNNLEREEEKKSHVTRFIGSGL